MAIFILYMVIKVGFIVWIKSILIFLLVAISLHFKTNVVRKKCFYIRATD